MIASIIKLTPMDHLSLNWKLRVVYRVAEFTSGVVTCKVEGEKWVRALAGTNDCLVLISRPGYAAGPEPPGA